MNDYYLKLIAKHLAKETTFKENVEVQNLLQKNQDFSQAYNESKIIWNNLEYTNTSFNKERILKIINKKIKKNKKKQQWNSKKIIQYAAVFIGLVLVFGGIYRDLNHQKTISTIGNKNKTYTLNDGSIIHLRAGSSISFSDSKILGFNRKLKINNGEAFFEIKKKHGKVFSVITPDYTINVLGTKFNVRCLSYQTDVILVEGKVELNNFDQEKYNEILMTPGEKVSYHRGGNKPKIKKVNANIYTLWMDDKLEFKQFSIQEIAEIFRIYFNKTVIIKDPEIEKIKIGGSAPSDDFNLILKGLSDILHRNIIHSNDSIIIE